MPTPISLEPPRPGDGSGLCEPRQREPERRGEKYGEAYEQKVRKKIAAKREREAYRAFRALFTAADGCNDRPEDADTDNGETNE